MGKRSFLKPVRRPVVIADFGSPVSLAASAQEAVEQQLPVLTSRKRSGLRYNFPAAGEEVAGGYTEDGYCFEVTFAAGRLERTYELVVAFLQEQGYGDLPIPGNAAELRLFKLPPKLRHQLSLFGDNGYVHNPIKILFPIPAGSRGALLLKLFNEATEDHLLQFHRLK